MNKHALYSGSIELLAKSQNEWGTCTMYYLFPQDEAAM